MIVSTDYTSAVFLVNWKTEAKTQRSNYRTMPHDKVQNVGLCLSTDWKTWNNINFGYFSLFFFIFCQISMDYKKFGPNNIPTNLLSQIFSSNTHFKLSLCLLF